MENGILLLNDNANKILRQKHLEPTEVSEDILLSDETELIHFIKDGCWWRETYIAIKQFRERTNRFA